MGKMHADELTTDESLVNRLVADQFPTWAGLPVRRVPSPGTVNALYRLGDDLVVRLPLVPWGADGVTEEYDLYRCLSPLRARIAPVRMPEPLALGQPAAGYPCPWAIYGWLEGTNPDPNTLAHTGTGTAAAVDLATDLATFALAMRSLDPTGAPDAYRGGPLTTQDPQTRGAITELTDLGLLDQPTAATLTDIWTEAVAAPSWPGPPVWVHGDLMPGNLLVADQPDAGRLGAVIDFGTAGVGDPACDLIPAWNLLPAGPARDAFRAGVEVDDATWQRGRARALSMALIQLPYYRDTNPAMADNARHVISAVLADT
jgi:aminoglycoside phosphotransferase (APT) family kinase protein